MTSIKSTLIVGLVHLLLSAGFPSRVEAQTTRLFPVLNDNSISKESCRSGYIDRSGDLIIGFKFYYTSDFSEGLAAVMLQKEGKWAYVNTKGDVVINGDFDEANSFREGYAVVEKNGGRFVIDERGSIVFTNRYITESFSEGLILARRAGTWGFIGRRGEIAVPFRFSDANDFHEGLAAVVVKEKIGYIDKSGSWVIEPRLETMEYAADWVRLPNFSEGLAVYRDGASYGYIDKKGLVVIPASFQRAMPFSEGLAQVSVGGKWGYIDKLGKFVIESKFDRGGSFSEGLAAVWVAGKWGYTNREGVMVVQPAYDTAASFLSGIAEVTVYDNKKKVTKRGYINQKGEFIYSWER